MKPTSLLLATLLVFSIPAASAHHDAPPGSGYWDGITYAYLDQDDDGTYDFREYDCIDIPHDAAPGTPCQPFGHDLDCILHWLDGTISHVDPEYLVEVCAEHETGKFFEERLTPRSEDDEAMAGFWHDIVCDAILGSEDYYTEPIDPHCEQLGRMMGSLLLASPHIVLCIVTGEGKEYRDDIPDEYCVVGKAGYYQEVGEDHHSALNQQYNCHTGGYILCTQFIMSYEQWIQDFAYYVYHESGLVY